MNLAAAVAALKHGQVVCFPTETFYGLAVDALNADAVEALMRLKGRGPTSAIGLIIPDSATAEQLVSQWPAPARALAQRFWPGPLTIVAPAQAHLPPALVGAGGGVGMRVSSHPIAAGLATAWGGPITATSANMAGQPPATTVQQAQDYFGSQVAVYLDGGASVAQVASTVVDVDDQGTMRVLREGAIASALLS